MKKIYLIIIGIILVACYVAYYRLCSAYRLQELQMLGCYAMLQLFYIVWSWHKLSGSYFDAYILFIVACYCFNLGQPIMEVFGVVPSMRSLIQHYDWPMALYCEGTLVSLAFIMAFHFGAVLSVRQPLAAREEAGNDDYLLRLKAIRRVAMPLAIVSCPFYMYNLVVQMVVSVTMGYKAIYNDSIGTSTLFKIIGDFYIPCIICLFFVSQATKKNTLPVMLVTLATIVIPPLVIGGRSNAIIILAVLYVAYSFFHKLSLKRLAIVGAGCYVMMVVFAAIAGNRNTANRNLSSLTQQKSEVTNPMFFTLAEMGGSEQPLMHCLRILPRNVDYKCGESYLYSLTTVIPNMGFWDVHPATLKANLGNWLQKYLSLGYGPGFSIVAEAYYNFGFYGFIMMMFLGFCFSRLYGLVSRIMMSRNPMAFIIGLVFLFFTIKLVRNSFEFAVRAIVYYCIPMYWLMHRKYVMYKQEV